MSEYGPEQLRFNLDAEGSQTDTGLDDGVSDFERFLNRHDIPWQRFKHYVETYGCSYADALRDFDVPKREITAIIGNHPVEESIPPGPSSSLSGRAIALNKIVGYFNQGNKTRGYGMTAHYGDSTGEVLAGMYGKTSRFGSQALLALMILSDGDSGVPMPEGDYLMSIGNELHSKFGPGNAEVSKREELLTKVFRAAGTTKAAHRRENKSE